MCVCVCVVHVHVHVHVHVCVRVCACVHYMKHAYNFFLQHCFCHDLYLFKSTQSLKSGHLFNELGAFMYSGPLLKGPPN